MYKDFFLLLCIMDSGGCVVFLDKALYSNSVLLFTWEYKWVPTNCQETGQRAGGWGEWG